MDHTTARRTTHAASTLHATALALALLAGAAGGCAGMRGPSESSYEANVRLDADSALHVARAQLEQHGFQVTPAGENAIVTAPHALPAPAQDGVPALQGRYWMLRVESQRRALAGGSRIRVTGFLLPPPPAAAAAAGGGATSQPAVVISSDNQPLFAEVRAAGRWITEAAGPADR